MNRSRLLGNFLLLFTAMIWGLAFVAQRSGMDLIEPMTFNATRTALGAACVGVMATIIPQKPDKGIDERTFRHSTIVGGVLCGIFLAVAGNLQQIGLVYTTAGKAGFITATYMLLVPVVNLLIFRKRSSLFVWVAVVIGLVGMYLLSIKEGFTLAKGDGLEAICAIFYTFQILSADHFTKKGNPIGISAIQLLTAAVINVVLAFIFETPSWDKIVSAAIPILYCGIMSSGVAYTLQMVGQKYSEPTTASILMSSESLFAMISGMIILHERMTGREALGAAIMFAAIIMVQFPGKRKD